MKTIEEIKKEILAMVESGQELFSFFVETLPKDDSVRELMCELGPKFAYLYAIYVDKCPREDTRKAACGDYYLAYWYATLVDNCPRDDTREASCRNPSTAYGYAKFIDKCPREDTRNSAYQNDACRKWYVREFGEYSYEIN